MFKKIKEMDFNLYVSILAVIGIAAGFVISWIFDPSDKFAEVGDKIETVSEKTDAVGDKVETVGTNVETESDKVESLGTKIDTVGENIVQSNRETASEIVSAINMLNDNRVIEEKPLLLTENTGDTTRDSVYVIKSGNEVYSQIVKSILEFGFIDNVNEVAPVMMIVFDDHISAEDWRNFLLINENYQAEYVRLDMEKNKDLYESIWDILKSGVVDTYHEGEPMKISYAVFKN